MSEEPEPLTTDSDSFVAISHRRLLYKMAAVIAFGTTAGFVFVSASVGFGVLIGGVLAFANYLWQKNSIKAIFERAVEGKRSRFLALRYILRYVVLGLALTLVYFTSTVSIFAVIFGLASFAIAVMIEGFSSLFYRSIDKES